MSRRRREAVNVPRHEAASVSRHEGASVSRHEAPSSRRRRPEADPSGAAADAKVAGTPEATPSGASRGTLYVVSTPIGNLADITSRALEVLRAASVIAAEDTRTTRVLLDRHSIAARDGGRRRLVSYHARNADRRGPELLQLLRVGADVALVTDAGTPGVSDPGAELVSAWAAEGGRVVPIPGASAVLAALAASGVAGPRWSFEGFLPRRGAARRERLGRIAADGRATVLFEAANRTASTLADLAAACGRERRAAVCRELTKLHEEILRGGLGELADAATDGRLTLRGEVVIVIGDADLAAGSRGSPVGSSTRTPVSPGDSEAGRHARRGRDAAAPGDPATLAAARSEVNRLMELGMGRADAVRRVAAETGMRRRSLYEVAETDRAPRPRRRGGGPS